MPQKRHFAFDSEAETCFLRQAIATRAADANHRYQTSYHVAKNWRTAARFSHAPHRMAIKKDARISEIFYYFAERDCERPLHTGSNMCSPGSHRNGSSQ